LKNYPRVKRAAIVEDILGTFGLVVWTSDPAEPALLDKIQAEYRELRPFVDPEGDASLLDHDSDPGLREIYEAVWMDGQTFEHHEDLRWVNRPRALGGWFSPLEQPPWVTEQGPPIIVFYSFKGGVGRTTGLAAFALQRAAAGERVAVIDLDLDAPGAGALLEAESADLRSHFGVVDYLLERPFLGDQAELRDYLHVCRPAALEGKDGLLVLPAGRLDAEYTGKLARLDLEPPEEGAPEILRTLLEDVRRQLDPDWILLDSRAGLSNPAGPLLSGLAHLHVVFAAFDEQSWQGLRVVLTRLAEQWMEAGRRQGDCVLVQGKVPGTLAKRVREEFTGRALDLFEETYYADPDAIPEDAEDVPYDLDDAASSDAPHVPCPVYHTDRLAAFERLDDVADLLLNGQDFTALGRRIAERFLPSASDEEPDGPDA
jgi:hypothetical protein